MKADDAMRLRELERENARLKRIVADQVLEPTPELALCPLESDPVLRLGLSSDEYWAYDALVVPDDEPRHRMLGHPDIVHDDPRRDPQEQLLLQLDFSQQPVFEFGEGRLYFFIAADDLAAGRLDRARVDYQQT